MNKWFGHLSNRRAASSPSAADDSDGGNEGRNVANALTGTSQQIKMLLLDTPEGFIDPANFRAKWLDKYKAELPLPANQKLKAFLSEAADQGACRLETRILPSGCDNFYVYPPHEGTRIEPPPSPKPTSTLTPTPPASPSLLQTGPASATVAKVVKTTFKNILGFGTTKKKPAPAAIDGLSVEDKGQTLDERVRPASVTVAEVVETTYEKARWLLHFKATRSELASDAFDGVSVVVVNEGKTLNVCVRDPRNLEQNQAAAGLGEALRQLAARIKVGEPLLLPGAVYENLQKDSELQSLAQKERVFALRPKKSSVPASGEAIEMRLVSDETSDVTDVLAHLSAEHTSIERELVLPPKLAHVSAGWLVEQFLQPAEASYRVKILFDGDKSKASFVGDNSGNGSGGGHKIIPVLTGSFQRLKMLLLDAPGGFLDPAEIRRKWRAKYGTDVPLTATEKLTPFLAEAAIAGACRLETRPGLGPLVHALPDGRAVQGGKGSKARGGAPGIASHKNTCRIVGVPWRVARAKAAIEEAVRATKFTSLKKNYPEPELVEELREVRKDLLRSGRDESSENGNDRSGRLLVSVFAPPPPSITPGASIPFVRVTLAMAPAAAGKEEAIGCAGTNCRFLRHSAPPPFHFTFEDALFCCSECRLSTNHCTNTEHGDECEARVGDKGSAASGHSVVGEFDALGEAIKRFETVLRTFGVTTFLISADFPKQVDALAASNALQKKLGDPQQAEEFAIDCGLKKVVWDVKYRDVQLVGYNEARVFGWKALKDVCINSVSVSAGAAAATLSTSSSSLGDAKELLWSDLEVGGVVGKGSFGQVKRGEWRGMDVAIKIITTVTASNSIDAIAASKAAAADLRHEAAVLARVCHHQNVVDFVGIVPDRLALVMRFMPNGSLQKLVYDHIDGNDGDEPRAPSIASPAPLTLANATAANILSSNASSAITHLPPIFGSLARDAILVRMVLEAAQGLKHLHSEGVIHRDVAARNVLVDADLHVRVADFGFARLKLAGRSQKGVYTTSNVGPIKWSAPEAIRRGRYSEASDVFSFGVLLYEIVARRAPWRGHNKMDVVVLVCKGDRMKLPSQVTDWKYIHGDDDDEDWCGEVGAETWDHTSEGHKGYTSWSGVDFGQDGDNSGSSGDTGSASSGGGDDNGGVSTTAEADKHQNVDSSTSACEVELAHLTSNLDLSTAPKADDDSGEARTGAQSYRECAEGAQHAPSTSGFSGGDVSASSGATNDNGNNSSSSSSTSQSAPWLLHMSQSTTQQLEALMTRCWAQDPEARPSMEDVVTVLGNLHSSLHSSLSSLSPGEAQGSSASNSSNGDELNYADASALWSNNRGDFTNDGGVYDHDGRNYTYSSESTPGIGQSSSTFQRDADEWDLNNSSSAGPRATSDGTATAASANQEVESLHLSPTPAALTEEAASESSTTIFGFGDLVQPDASLAAWEWQASDNEDATTEEAAIASTGTIFGFGDLVQLDTS